MCFHAMQGVDGVDLLPGPSTPLARAKPASISQRFYGVWWASIGSYRTAARVCSLISVAGCPVVWFFSLQHPGTKIAYTQTYVRVTLGQPHRLAGVLRTLPYLELLLAKDNDDACGRGRQQQITPLLCLYSCPHRNTLVPAEGTKPCRRRTHNANGSKILRASETEMVGSIKMVVRCRDRGAVDQNTSCFGVCAGGPRTPG